MATAELRWPAIVFSLCCSVVKFVVLVILVEAFEATELEDAFFVALSKSVSFKKKEKKEWESSS